MVKKMNLNVGMKRKKSLVPVWMLGKFEGYNGGEVAGFPAEKAAKLVKAGKAAPLKVDKDGKFVEPLEPDLPKPLPKRMSRKAKAEAEAEAEAKAKEKVEKGKGK